MCSTQMRGTQKEVLPSLCIIIVFFLMEITTISVKTLDSVDHFLVVVLFYSPDGSTIALAEVGQCLKQ